MPRADRRAAAAAVVLLALSATGAGAAWPVAGTRPATGTVRSLPAAPTGLVVTASGCTVATLDAVLRWDAVAAVTGCTVTKSVVGGPSTTVTTTTATTTTDTVALGSLVTCAVIARLGAWSGATSAPVAVPTHC